MRRDNPITAAFLPYAAVRCGRFCELFDTDTRPLDIMEQIWRMYAAGDTRLGLWIIVHEDQIIGHTMAQPEPIDAIGKWSYVLIRQAQVDEHFDTRALVRQSMYEVEEWTKGLGVNRLVMLTHRNAETMSRRWGFRNVKTLMEKNLE